MESLEPTHLCNACQGIIALERSTYQQRSRRIVAAIRGQHAFALLQTPSLTHHGIKALQASADNGCHLCLLLWGQMYPHDRAALLQSVANSSKDISCQIYVEGSPLCIRVGFSYDGPKSGTHARMTFHLYRMKGETFRAKKEIRFTCLFCETLTSPVDCRTLLMDRPFVQPAWR